MAVPGQHFDAQDAALAMNRAAQAIAAVEKYLDTRTDAAD